MKNIILICALISSQAQSAVIKIDDPIIEQHLKGFVQTHAACSRFVSVVIDNVRLSEDDTVKSSVQMFREFCDRELSYCLNLVEEVQPFVQQYFLVHEEEGDFQQYKYVEPAAAEGVSVMPNFKEWEALQAKQKEHGTALMNVFATRDLVDGQLYSSKLAGYLEGVARLGEYFQGLLDDLAVAKQKSDRMAEIVQDSKCFIQTHAALSECVSVVFKSVSSSENYLVMRAAQRLRPLCDCELSELGEIVKKFPSLIQECAAVHEEEKSAPQDGCVVPDVGQEFNVAPYIQKLNGLQAKQRQHVTALTAKFEGDLSCCFDLGRYFDYLFMLGSYLERLFEDLAVAQKESEHMVVVLHDFAQTHRKIKDWGARVFEYMDGVPRGAEKTDILFRVFIDCIRRDQAPLQERLLKLDSIAFKIQMLEKSLPVHKEEKRAVQEHKVMAYDDRCDWKTCEIEYQKLQSHQNQTSDALLDCLTSCFVGNDFFGEHMRNILLYKSNLNIVLDLC
ncbi:MAG: hypothetical protein OXC30_01095 [Alphaproteobacteria bacterium]|nr:hypothetical protein [Alphaproteobacteria bacterium]